LPLITLYKVVGTSTATLPVTDVSTLDFVAVSPESCQGSYYRFLLGAEYAAVRSSQGFVNHWQFTVQSFRYHHSGMS